MSKFKTVKIRIHKLNKMVNTRSGERVNITKKIEKIALKNQFIDSACDRLFDALTDELIDNILETETLNNIFIDSACDSLFDTLASELIDNSLEVLALVEPRKKFPNLKKSFYMMINFRKQSLIQSIRTGN